MISVINIILALIVLMLIPVLVGNSICAILKFEITMGKAYAVGFVGMWAILQLITVPLVMLKQSFIVVVIAESVLICALCLYGLIKRQFASPVPKLEGAGEKCAFAAVCIIVVALLAVTALMQHTDADDSRFVVNAVDIVRTNKMFLTNPATGQPIAVWEGELIKDITSPWAVFIAYCAKVTGIHATIMAHTFLPIALTLMMCVVYWMLSDIFFRGDIVYRSVFTIMAIILNIYGYYSVYSAETFAITRIWQGKAVVASVGIPLIFLISMWIYENIEQNGLYVLLFMTGLAMCLMSGMGIIIGAVMLGCIGFLYGVMKKSFKVFFKMIAAVLPCIIYFAIYTAEKDFFS